MATLIIADPPYPPRARRDGSGATLRASRHYGKIGEPEYHPDAAAWDRPAKHRELLEQLEASADGWAIATTPDGVACYGPLPAAVRLMAWVRPNAAPGGNVLRSTWEVVILRQVDGRHVGRGQVSDVLTAAAARSGFIGAKPPAWTAWVLAALRHDPEVDTVVDLFPGSGAVATAAAQLVIPEALS